MNTPSGREIALLRRLAALLEEKFPKSTTRPFWPAARPYRQRKSPPPLPQNASFEPPHTTGAGLDSV